MSEVLADAFRLSPQQGRVWRLQHSDAQPTYRTQGAVLIDGELDADRLAASLTEGIERHQMLRATFHHLPGIASALQTVAASQKLELPVTDLSDLTADERAARLEALWREAACLPLDLRHAPAMRASLYKLAAQQHLLLLCVPALCADRLALDNLVRDLSHSYAPRHREEETGEGAMEYLVYSEWQNELLDSEDAEFGKAYWSGLGLSALPPLRLPFERPGAGARATDWQSVSVEIPAPLVGAIEADARRYDMPLPPFFLACWQILLSRLSRQADVVVGVNFSGRSDEDLVLTLGLFEKYLPIQGQVKAGARFRDLLAGIDEAARTALDWQECFTWDAVLSASGQADDGDFFAYGFEFVEHPAPYVSGAVSFSLVRCEAQTERFKMKLAIVRRDGGLSAVLQYDASCFATADIERTARQYRRLLESAAKTPEAAIGELELLTQPERHQLVKEFNNRRADFSTDHRLHRQFEMQAARAPERLAVEFEDQRLTYGELNARANQLARYLRRQGVGPESLVGLFVERSVEMMVGLLAIWKAGGAYLPIDPGYPADRVRCILQDAQPLMLLTQERLGKRLEGQAGAVFCIDGDWQAAGSESAEDFESGVRDENLAYVIYTSGSTGKPKGVMIAHRAIGNRLLWMQSRFPLQADSRLLQKTSISFDASVWELFLPLISGATLVIARPGGHQDSAYLVRTIAERNITTLQLVPSMLQVLLEEPGVQDCTSLRDVFCGGEALPAALQAKFYSLLKAELHNLYGPTEVSIDATFWDCEADDRQGIVPIGRPLDNVEVYLLDESQQLVPMGVAGEIYVGGAGLARGYVNRPDLTAERFIPEPFSGAPGRRLYRTGDLARHLPDGAIEFLGRVDHQVKLRGFRIELGEIEATLAAHALVERAVVVVQDDEPLSQRLVAYVVAHTGLDPDREQLRGFLEEKLPEYMLPSAFVFLDRLPLTPNGKIDRQALPRVEDARAGIGGGFEAPRTAVEELLAGMWAELLNVEKVGIHDNFFELGGHSLLAIRMNSRLQSAFQVEVPLDKLFEYPTVAALSGLVDSLVKSGRQETEEAIQAMPRDGDLPLSFAQQRLWFLYELEPDNPVYNIPVAVHLSGGLDSEALARALDEIVSRHEVLRTSYSSSNGRRVQTIHAAARLDIPLVSLESEPVEGRWAEVERLARQEAALPFDLQSGLPVRARLLRLSEHDHVLLFTMHHIASDAWSMNLAVREFAALYSAFRAGAPSPLASLPIQYADFAVWQRQRLAGDVLDGQMAYWKQQLANCSTAVELPTDRPRPAAQTSKGAKEPLVIAPPLYQEIASLSRREDATLFMTLLAALQVVLHYHSGQADLNIGSNIAGRTRLETEGLIGFFINLLVMRANLTGDPPFRELLTRVRRTAVGAFAHQDVPFDKLVEELQPPRDPARTPLVQVVFDFVSNPVTLPSLPGLDLRILPFGEQAGKFDLVLNIEVREQRLEGALQYNTDLFDRSTAARILKHFELVLQRAVEDSQVTVSALKDALAECDKELQRAERAGFREQRQRMMRQAKEKDRSGIVA